MFYKIKVKTSKTELEVKKILENENIEIINFQTCNYGRPKKAYPDNWSKLYIRYLNGKLKAKDFMKETNLKKATFYKMLKSYENNL